MVNVLALVVLLARLDSAWGQDEGSQTKRSNVGYIDSALPVNAFMFRMDDVYGANRTDRAGYRYLQSDPNVGSQDYAPYLELAYNDRLSGFLQMNFVAANPTFDPNVSGLGDTNLGFKWAFLSSDNQVATFQFRTYLPTGNPLNYLGTGHVSLEPGFLFYQQLTDECKLEGMFKDWIGVGSSDFIGNILNYGLGISYMVYEREQVNFSPVLELVGWTVLSGKETIAPPTIAFNPDAQYPIKSAAGDTIINLKMGLRTNLGDYGSLYLGYGRPLTGDYWYKDLIRLEYRFTF
jgi:hypothetical protein